MNDPKLKQQIADKIKNSSNILVTVSNDPSVDELSAALGLTLLLNKMDKHATAVFSGHIPPAITFLDPEKTFEDTTDSLRDFIIALDKEKADHLRYKLEGDFVKIYITPYRTTITSNDLEFSQGDYNVELVIALGVENKDHLDAALVEHGKILHDATVITLTAGEQVSNLGSIDWHDSNASSLGEMLTALSDTMKLDKGTMDKSIATAWLTGIVAATERFSNPRTSSRAMTIAANLMAAGADQQLIAAKLEESQQETEDDTPNDQQSSDDGDNGELTEGKTAKLPKGDKEQALQEAPAPKRNGELVINHEKEGTIEEVAREVGAERLEESARAAERALEKQEEAAAMAPVEPTEMPVEQSPAAPAPKGAVEYMPPVSSEEHSPEPNPVSAPQPMEEGPALGGTLNATSEQAEEDKRREIERDQNKVILSHGYIGGHAPTYDAPINAASDGQLAEPSVPDIFAGAADSSPVMPQAAPTVTASPLVPPSEATPAPAESPASAVPAYVPPAPSDAALPPVAAPTPAPTPTLADIDAQNRASDDARAAIDAAFAASGEQQSPVMSPVDMPAPAQLPDAGLPLPPPVPDFSASGLPPMPPMPPAAQPDRLGDIFAPEQPAPAAPVSLEPPINLPPADPAQYRIPGQ